MDDNSLKTESHSFSVENHEIMIETHTGNGAPDHSADIVALQDVCVGCHNTSGFKKRLIVSDGVTPRDSTLMGETDMARYASEKVIAIISRVTDAKQGMLKVNDSLQSLGFGKNSPAASCGVVDFHIDTNAGKFPIVARAAIAGDPLYYIHNADGWVFANGDALLKEGHAKEFAKLFQSAKEQWDKADSDFEAGLHSQSEWLEIKKRITEDWLTPREEKLLSGPEAWLSPPIGRFPSEVLRSRDLSPKTRAANFPATITGLDGFIISTDGAKIDLEKLKQLEKSNVQNGIPASYVPADFFEKVHSGADRALATVCLVY